LDLGLGLYRGVVALPHAEHRLRLDDPVRVGLFAERFAPAVCVAMDSGARLHWDGERWTAGPGTPLLTASGDLEEREAWS
ncbi:MAG: hypothetical protein KDD11_07665, partial [Acidobacteria bacterium]|nr:hypothetical protein [Acidobacteriota bacterium]